MEEATGLASGGPEPSRANRAAAQAAYLSLPVLSASVQWTRSLTWKEGERPSRQRGCGAPPCLGGRCWACATAHVMLRRHGCQPTSVLAAGLLVTHGSSVRLRCGESLGQRWQRDQHCTRQTRCTKDAQDDRGRCGGEGEEGVASEKISTRALVRFSKNGSLAHAVLLSDERALARAAGCRAAGCRAATAQSESGPLLRPPLLARRCVSERSGRAHGRGRLGALQLC